MKLPRVVSAVSHHLKTQYARRSRGLGAFTGGPRGPEFKRRDPYQISELKPFRKEASEFCSCTLHVFSPSPPHSTILFSSAKTYEYMAKGFSAKPAGKCPAL